MRNGMTCEKILSRIENLLGVSKIGIDIIDSRFNIRYIDPAWQKVYGNPSGKKCYRYFMGRKTVCPHCGIVKALRTKKITVTEEALVKEGNRPIQVTTIPFKDESGEWLVAETNVDISRIKKAEEALIKEDSDFKTILNSAPIIIFYKDALGKFLRVNRIFAESLGMPQEKFVGKTVFDLYSGDIAKKMANDDRQVMSSGKPKLGIIERYESKQGLRWVRTDKIPIFDRDGKTMGLVGFAQDITERKKIEEALRESEDKYRRLFEKSIDAIFIADPKTRLTVDCNVQAERITGYSRAELLSMRADRLPPKDEKGAALKGFMRMAAGLDAEVETEILTKDKKRRVVSIRGTPIMLGGRACVMGIFRDITERKRAEEILRRDKSELARLVERKSAELVRAHDELNKAKRLSDIGMLAATVAHELRNPLAAIRIAIYNIKKKSDDPRLGSHLDNMEKKILESDQIIKNLLLYSSVKVPHRQAVVVSDLMEQSVTSLRSMFDEYKVSIKRFYKCPEGMTIEADPVQIKEVFNNLLSNAYESFGLKKGRIDISIWTEKEALKVRIADNGRGVPGTELRKLFMPFFSTKAKGLGLGLPLCRQIIELHGGSIKIESRVGKGTTVTVRLPIARARNGASSS